MYDDIRIAAIGGGTGLSTMLRGLKAYTPNLTAIVTVADDGGSSGILRNDLGILPPGDIRNCLIALADAEPTLKKLFTYRFKEGSLAGHAFGNLFLAAMTEICSGFDEAVKKTSDVLAVVGKVLPVTCENISLFARIENGSIIRGESNIGMPKTNNLKIERVFLEPELPRATDGVIKAIHEADIIVLGPGSLYTSIMPNLLVDGVADAIKESDATKIYVCNIMTQAGETDNYSVADHIHAIEKHTHHDIVDFVIANNQKIPAFLEEKYREERSFPIVIDEENLTNTKTRLVQGNLVLIEDEYVRHNFTRLARAIMNIYKFTHTQQ